MKFFYYKLKEYLNNSHEYLETNFTLNKVTKFIRVFKYSE